MDRGNSLPSILEQKVRAAPAAPTPALFIKMHAQEIHSHKSKQTSGPGCG